MYQYIDRVDDKQFDIQTFKYDLKSIPRGHNWNKPSIKDRNKYNMRLRYMCQRIYKDEFHEDFFNISKFA